MLQHGLDIQGWLKTFKLVIKFRNLTDLEEGGCFSS